MKWAQDDKINFPKKKVNLSNFQQSCFESNLLPPSSEQSCFHVEHEIKMRYL